MGKNTLDEKFKPLARELGISDNLLKLLLHRGMSGYDIPDFLHPSLDRLSSPFEIDGMYAAAERLQKAINKKEKITVFGDYDCDGICAVSILVLALRGTIDIDYFIPERGKDGYGLTVDALKKIIDQNKPDLIITVDCGITSVAEVDYLKQCGLDIIITDHHEPQEAVPDCIVVDPKIKKIGFYELCGAGVALKLVEALFGKTEAEKYLDIAAIATVADVVPLIKDNRIIAYYGMKAVNRNPRKGLKLLLDSEKISSGEIMFHLAPKMNAAGRLNSAMKVVELFLASDHFTLKTLSEELSRDNERRQEICGQVVAEAGQMLKGTDFNKTRIIILEHEGWEAGVLGIAASRLAEEFGCPAILFAKNGELKGSARTVDGVNLFELLSKFSEYFIAYGGHSQAAGITMLEQNFDKFRAEVNKEIIEKYGCNAFETNDRFDEELDLNDDLLSFAKELELLEPTGNGNQKPKFVIDGDGLKFENIGFTQHVKCCLPNLDIVGFGKYGHLTAIRRGKQKLGVTLGVNEFQNRLTAQAVIKTASVTGVGVSDEECDVLCVNQIGFDGEAFVEKINSVEIEECLKKTYGTLFVCFNGSEYNNLISAVPIIGKLPVFVSAQRDLCPENAVVIAPSAQFDFRFYQTTVIAGKAFSNGYLKHISDECVSVKAFGDCAPRRIFVSENAFRSVYILMRKYSAGSRRFSSANQLFSTIAAETGLSALQFSAVYKTLTDLGLISVSVRGIISVSNVKTDLNSSAAYRNLDKV